MTKHFHADNKPKEEKAAECADRKEEKNKNKAALNETSSVPSRKQAGFFFVCVCVCVFNLLQASVALSHTRGQRIQTTNSVDPPTPPPPRCTHTHLSDSVGPDMRE